MNLTAKRVALRWRRTKIVATLGPASSDTKTITELLKAGVDVVRLNMSHGTHDAHREVYQRVRAAAKKLDLIFLGYAVALCRNYSDALARRTFRYSILYLTLLFAALFADRLIAF